MRSDIQEIFKMTPHDKQVMMFSATLSQDIRGVCKKFMSNVRALPPVVGCQSQLCGQGGCGVTVTSAPTELQRWDGVRARELRMMMTAPGRCIAAAAGPRNPPCVK